MIELVATPNRPIGAEQRRTGERQIAEGIKRLMTHEFVGEP